MKLIVKAGRVIDGTGAAPDARDAVLIEDGRIAAVDRFEAIGVTSDAEVIDVPGGTVLPGFVEVHSHMHCSASPSAFDDLATDSHEALVARAVEAVRAALGSGVTTMRDLGSRNEIAFPIRSAIESGIVPGPHLMVAGTPITTTGGHCHMFGTEADSLDEVLTALRGQVKLGADWIKIMSTGGRFTPRTNPRMPQYPVEALRAAVVDAERLGVRVAAHCHAASGVRNCVEAGVHNLIHASWMSEDPEGGYDYDPAVADEIAEKGLYVDPTIAATGALRELRGPRVAGAEPRQRVRPGAALRDTARHVGQGGQVRHRPGLRNGLPAVRRLCLGPYTHGREDGHLAAGRHRERDEDIGGVPGSSGRGRHPGARQEG
jgi:imidazolonepropionase-like amidohydrolase